MTESHDPEHVEAARLDYFVDGAFAFAVTLLLIGGGGVPHSTTDLVMALKNVPAFGMSFAQLAFFWRGHVNWRRHAGRVDHRSLQLSLVFVFLALIFVYPLHMVFASLASLLTGGWLPTGFEVRTAWDLKSLFIVYGLSYATLAATLAWLYADSARSFTGRPRERSSDPRIRTVFWCYVSGVGLVSTLLALLVPARTDLWLTLPGFSYGLLAFVGPILKRYHIRLSR